MNAKSILLPNNKRTNYDPLEKYSKRRKTYNLEMLQEDVTNTPIKSITRSKTVTKEVARKSAQIIDLAVPSSSTQKTLTESKNKRPESSDDIHPHINKVKVEQVALPKFDGKINVNVRKWLHQLESFGKQYSWDEANLIDSMKKSLEGNALYWYNHQEYKICSWDVWKTRLISEYGNAEVLSEFQEFICLYKSDTEELLDFYNTKKILGKKFGFKDALVCNIIINRLDDPRIKKRALSKHYADMKLLHEFLKSYQINSVPYLQ